MKATKKPKPTAHGARLDLKRVCFTITPAVLSIFVRLGKGNRSLGARVAAEHMEKCSCTLHDEHGLGVHRAKAIR